MANHCFGSLSVEHLETVEMETGKVKWLKLDANEC